MEYKSTYELKEVLEKISDGVFILDKNWTFIFINKGVEDYYGIKKEDFIGHNFWTAFPLAEELKYKSEFNRSIEQQVSVHFEEYSQVFNKWALVNAYPLNEGLVVYFHDITRQKNSQENLKSEEENLRKLINNTEDPIWSVDNKCNILLCNNAFKKWLFHFIGKEMDKGDNVLSPELGRIYLDKFEMCYNLALIGRSFKAVEDWNDGDEVRYSAITFNPVFSDDKSKVIGVSCFARDITDQRKHLFKIEEQNVALKDIAFIQSHKVRGPVASILGLTQLFNYEVPPDSINNFIIQGVISASLDLDQTIRTIVKKSNEIGI